MKVDNVAVVSVYRYALCHEINNADNLGFTALPPFINR